MIDYSPQNTDNLTLYQPVSFEDIVLLMSIEYNSTTGLSKLRRIQDIFYIAILQKSPQTIEGLLGYFTRDYVNIRDLLPGDAFFHLARRTEQTEDPNIRAGLINILASIILMANQQLSIRDICLWGIPVLNNCGL